jgi:chorismate mutase
LIERAQFRQNAKVYEKGGVPGLSTEGDTSFLDFMLSGTEKLHSAVRRYESPEEHAFFPDRLPPQSESMEQIDYPNLLSNDPAINELNWNPILYQKYLNVIVPSIAAKGDDEQYGSTCVTDTAALQALSKRIHYGKFVAESKYRSNPEGFQRLVDAGDADGVMELLTNAKVEEQVLTRARLKATTYGREPMLSSFPMTRNGKDGDSTSIIAAAAAMAVVAAVEAMQDSGGDEDNVKVKGKVDPAIIEAIYRELIIPMTKDIEVAYLFLRCGREPPKEYASDRMSIDVTKLSPRRAI